MLKIGVIDSGIGGITTLKSLSKCFNAEYYYYHDGANMPYGNKSAGEITSIAVSIIDKMSILDIDIFVIACNTLTAIAIDKLRQNFNKSILGIEPAIKPLVGKEGKTVIMATHNTIASPRFARLLKKNGNVEIIECHDLAKLIEDNNIEGARKCVREILAKHDGVRNVVLGCTHYVFLRDYIESLGYYVIDGNYGVAKELIRIAERKGSHNESDGDNSIIFIHSSSICDIGRVAYYLKKPIFFW